MVIWSSVSVGSRFVRDEARFALDQNKLISTRTADLDIQLVPLGFQGQHVEVISNRDQIAKAVDRLCGRSADDDIDADYKKAQALFSARQYAAAAVALREFIERLNCVIPDHPLRGAAHFWCGEAHYLNGNFLEAQQILGIGFARYRRTPFPPMMLVRQAMCCAHVSINLISLAIY